MRVNIEGLRPWEYDQMSAWDYDRIRHALDVFDEVKRDLPPTKQKARHENTWELNPDEGPQYVLDEP